jgi:hypothetical protein
VITHSTRRNFWVLCLPVRYKTATTRDIDRNFGETMNRFAGALSSDAVGDLQREFMPDIKRLFRKHAPKEIRKIEEKLPIPADDKP